MSNNWISVKERVPEHGQMVLIAFGPTRTISLARYDNHKSYPPSWLDAIRGTEQYAPDFWQPLPEPPPKPDAFDEFWAKWAIWQNGEEALRFQNSVIHKNGARLIWDAAIASTKGNP